MDDAAREQRERVLSGLEAVQELQAEYDEVGWRLAGSSHEKVRHLLLHLAKALGDIATVVERNDHLAADGHPPSDAAVASDLRAIRGRTADLVGFAAQLASMSDERLGTLVIERVAGNAKRWAPDSALSQLTDD